MADLTNRNYQVPGVNSDTNYLKQRAFMLDLGDAAIAAVDTHDFATIPAGEAIANLRIVVLEAVTSSGSGTLQFKASFNKVAEALHQSALAVANLAAGDVHNVAVAGVKGVDMAYEGVLQLTVGSAALTGGKVLVIVETLPAADFVRKG
jgi:hypothetical protein